MEIQFMEEQEFFGSQSAVFSGKTEEDEFRDAVCCKVRADQNGTRGTIRVPERFCFGYYLDGTSLCIVGARRLPELGTGGSGGQTQSGGEQKGGLGDVNTSNKGKKSGTGSSGDSMSKEDRQAQKEDTLPSPPQEFLRELWPDVGDRLAEDATAEEGFLELLQEITRDDVMYLQQMEKALGKVEDTLMERQKISFSKMFLRYRKRLATLHVYYEQMVAIGEYMQKNTKSGDQEMTDAWEQFTDRMERLCDLVNYLREYIAQLRDLCHTMREDSHNQGIRFLTLVTALFLPLTLLTSWYGMNFKAMPETGWEHGYHMVIIGAVLIISCEVFVIKHKRIV